MYILYLSNIKYKLPRSVIGFVLNILSTRFICVTDGLKAQDSKNNPLFLVVMSVTELVQIASFRCVFVFNFSRN